MFLSKKIPIYDQRSGKPNSFEFEHYAVVDDYTGEILKLGTDEEQDSNLYRVEIKYDSGSVWYYDRLPGFLKSKYKHLADAYSLLNDLWSNPYHFFFKDGRDSSFDLISDWMVKRKKNFKDITMIEEVFRVSRVCVIEKLLKKKKITLEHLQRFPWD